MTTYQSGSALKETLSLVGETFMDNDIDLALEAASRGIDELCNDRFYPAPGTYVFDPESPYRVKLRPSAATITSVAVDMDGDGTHETPLDSSDYLAWPYNNPNEAKPWWELHLRRDGIRFPNRPAAVQVAGTFGWGTIPAPITQATGLLAAKLLKRSREAPFGIAVFGTEGGVAMRIARTDPDIMFLLGPFMRDRVVVA